MTYENLHWELTPGNFTKVVALILILELKVENEKSPYCSTTAHGIDVRPIRTNRYIEPDVMLRCKKEKKNW